MGFWASFSITFTAIFVALDTIGTVPTYLALTKEMPISGRRAIVDRSMIVALVVALAFMAGGQTIFHQLGISLYDFRIAGGLVLLLIALADLLGRSEMVNRSSGSTGIVPLAVPLITGPGVLTTLLLQVGAVGYPITILALVVNYAIGWTILRYCDRVTKVIGRDGTTILSKISALLLAAIAVAMIRNGLFDSFGEYLRTLKH